MAGGGTIKELRDCPMLPAEVAEALAKEDAYIASEHAQAANAYAEMMRRTKDRCGEKDSQ